MPPKPKNLTNSPNSLPSRIPQLAHNQSSHLNPLKSYRLRKWHLESFNIFFNYVR